MTAPRSLPARLLLAVLALLVGVWSAAAAFTWLDTRHELGELLDGHLAQAAALLVVQQVPELGEDEHARAAEAPELHRYAPRAVFQVFHEGRLGWARCASCRAGWPRVRRRPWSRCCCRVRPPSCSRCWTRSTACSCASPSC